MAWWVPEEGETENGTDLDWKGQVMDRLVEEAAAAERLVASVRQGMMCTSGCSVR